MDFTTRQQHEQRALAAICQYAQSLYELNASGRQAGTSTKYRDLLLAVKDLYLDEGLIQDAISDTVFEWDEEERLSREMGTLDGSDEQRPVVVLDCTR